MSELIHEMGQLATCHAEKPSDLRFGPASDDDVRQVEHELGVTLPRSFRAYLKGFAGGLMLGYEMCGIPTDRARIPLPRRAPRKTMKIAMPL